MGLFSRKSSAQPQRVTSHASTSRAPVRPTENAFIPDGGGNIDYGAAMANRVAAESRQQIEQKQQHDRLLEQQSSAMMQESMNSQRALNQSGPSSQVAAVSVQTLVDIKNLRKPAWAHHFAEHGLDAGLMGALQDVFELNIKRAEVKLEKEKIRGQAVEKVIQHFGDNAARVSNQALGKMGITVSVKFYHDQAQKKVFYQFKVPASVQERDAWKKDLIAKYNLKS